MLRAGTSPAQPLPACTLTVGPGSFLRWGKTSPWPGGGRREAPTIGGCSSIPGVRACAVGLAARLCLGLGGAVGLLRRRGAKAPLQPWPHPGSLLRCQDLPCSGELPPAEAPAPCSQLFYIREGINQMPTTAAGSPRSPSPPWGPSISREQRQSPNPQQGSGERETGGKEGGEQLPPPAPRRPPACPGAELGCCSRTR